MCPQPHPINQYSRVMKSDTEFKKKIKIIIKLTGMLLLVRRSVILKIVDYLCIHVIVCDLTNKNHAMCFGVTLIVRCASYMYSTYICIELPAAPSTVDLFNYLFFLTIQNTASR